MCLDWNRWNVRSSSACDPGRSFPAIIVVSVISVCGCVNVKAPDSIVIGGHRPARVDSGQVPPITTVEQGRAELDKAYRNIRLVEDENRALTLDNARLTRERDDFKIRVEKLD